MSGRVRSDSLGEKFCASIVGKAVEEGRGHTVFRLVLMDVQCVGNERRSREGALLSAMLKGLRAQEMRGQQRRLKRNS